MTCKYQPNTISQMYLFTKKLFYLLLFVDTWCSIYILSFKYMLWIVPTILKQVKLLKLVNYDL